MNKTSWTGRLHGIQSFIIILINLLTFMQFEKIYEYNKGICYEIPT